MKYLGIELGSQTIFKGKGNDITTIINGAFTDEELKKCLDKFIDKYVLCKGCHYPEMCLKVKKDLVGGKCDSCGHSQQLDNSHKIATYIVKNPPPKNGIKKE